MSDAAAFWRWKRIVLAMAAADYLMNLLQKLVRDASQMDGAAQVCVYAAASTAADLQKHLLTALAFSHPPEGPAFECARCTSRLRLAAHDPQKETWVCICTFCEETIMVTGDGQVIERGPLWEAMRALVLKGDEPIGP